ncbi:MAG: caspase family protein, partial [Hyphomicrobiales bacterium]|nr:caspase family protein [Hyphomicrobiales bacterium]
MVRQFLAFLTLAVCLLAGAPALAEKRVALVIGNSAYQHTSPLPNPANDAAAIAKRLTEIGFDTVEVKLDQSFSDLRRTLQGFSRAARDSDVALVFYAGHGMEVGGINYLVPVDARLQSDQDVPYEAFPLDLVLAAIEPARRLRLIMLDACRDNPLAAQMTNTSGSTRSIGRGLARIEPQGDTLVAYASKAGSVAEDGDGANSPFTTALLQHLPTPGLDIRLMFGRVRDAVLEKTGRRQEPFVYGSLGGGELSLVPGGASGAATNAPGGMSGAGGAGVDRAALDLAFWSSIQGSSNAELYKSYLTEFPDGRFRVIAEAKLVELDKLAALPAESPPSRPPAVTHAPPP